MRSGIALLLLAPILSAQEPVDLSMVSRIRGEAFQNSKVMETLSMLTNRYGPRLTGSKEFDEAAAWALKRLQEYGLQNGKLEKWGPFGKSWSIQQYAVEMVEPRYSLMTAVPQPWSRGTDGPVTGEVVVTPLTRTLSPRAANANLTQYMEKYKGKLRGRIVLMTAAHTTPAMRASEFARYSDAELADLAKAPEPQAKMSIDPKHIEIPEDESKIGEWAASLPPGAITSLFERIQAINAKRNRFLMDEGALAVLTWDNRSHEGLVFTEQAASQDKQPLAVPTFSIAQEYANRLARLVEAKETVKVRVNLSVSASENAVDAANVTAELPGGRKRDEVVMLGAHFDSWAGGTGATDNAAGSAVMIEVMRILTTLKVPMDRTVRIALWSGEEQGLLGSRAYVKEHFGDPATMKVTAAHSKLSGYVNLDNGSGKIRGVYLQGNDAMRPLFEQWLKPFRDVGVSTVSIRNTGGTDHLSFDAVGLPGFQFIQDPLDYMTVTHHSNLDVYDHAQEGDLMQAAAVIASVVYDAATRPEMLRRKALPKAQPTIEIPMEPDVPRAATGTR